MPLDPPKAGGRSRFRRFFLERRNMPGWRTGRIRQQATGFKRSGLCDRHGPSACNFRLGTLLPPWSGTFGSSSSSKPSNRLRDSDGFGSPGSQPVDAITGVCRAHGAASSVPDIPREQWRQCESLLSSNSLPPLYGNRGMVSRLAHDQGTELVAELSPERLDAAAVPLEYRLWFADFFISMINRFQSSAPRRCTTTSGKTD